MQNEQSKQSLYPQNRDTSNTNRQEKVSGWWSEEAKKRTPDVKVPRLDWSTSPTLEMVINRRITGIEDQNWIGWLRQEHIPEPLDLGLSIGCGSGILERDVLDQGLCREMEGVDIASDAITVARNVAGALPIKYKQHDLESEPLPLNRYDVVFCAIALHHINHLDFCLDQVYQSLKENGLFIIHEYIGPCRFQWKPGQMKLVSDLYEFLPISHRYNYHLHGTALRPLRPEICSMIVNDPSEAIRSIEMLEVVERYYERIGRRNVGGTILNPLLGGLLENFADDDELDLSFLGLVALLEEFLIDKGFLESDFIVDVYRRRSSPLGGAKAKQADRSRSEKITGQEGALIDYSNRRNALAQDREELLKRLYETRNELMKAKEALNKLLIENNSLKSGPLFQIARVVRRSLNGKRPHPEEASLVVKNSNMKIAGNPVSPSCLPLPLPSASNIAVSTKTRKLIHFLERLKATSEVLWLRWLCENIGKTGSKAMMIGLEPSLAAVAKTLGLFMSVDLADFKKIDGENKLVITWPDDEYPAPSEKYDVVLLELSAKVDKILSKNPGALSSLLSEDSLLVVTRHRDNIQGVDNDIVFRLLDCLPSSWIKPINSKRLFQDTDKFESNKDTPFLFGKLESVIASEFTQTAERRFGRFMSTFLVDHLTPDQWNLNEMSKAIAGLLLYIESCLLEHGLLAPSLEIRVYRKGTKGKEIGSHGLLLSDDIVELQEREIKRVKNILNGEKLYNESLNEQLNEHEKDLKRINYELNCASREREMLTLRGSKKYIKLLIIKRQRGKYR